MATCQCQPDACISCQDLVTTHMPSYMLPCMSPCTACVSPCTHMHTNHTPKVTGRMLKTAASCMRSRTLYDHITKRSLQSTTVQHASFAIQSICFPLNVRLHHSLRHSVVCILPTICPQKCTHLHITLQPTGQLFRQVLLLQFVTVNQLLYGVCCTANQIPNLLLLSR